VAIVLDQEREGSMTRGKTRPPDSDGTTVHYRACNLCEAICGVRIEVADGRIGSIRGDDRDPFSRGHICAKAVALKDVHEDPDRVRRPLRRTGSDFEEIGWDEALDEAADRLKRIRKEHGRRALAVYLGNPVAHNWGSMLFGQLFIRALNPGNRFSATSVDQLPHHLSAFFMYGHQLLLPVPDIDHTDFMLMIGANPLVSNGSLMTAPDMRHRLRSLRDRDGRLVVVDPRRTETAKTADQHIFIHPGSDALLLAALVHTVFDEDLADLGRLDDLTDGVGTVKRLLRPFSAETVADVVGIDRTAIRGLARDFATARSAVAYGRMGASVQPYGGLCQWLIQVLNIVTGNFDRRGGMMFPQPAVDWLDFYGPGGYNRFRSRVRELPEFGGELPVAAMAEDMLAQGPNPIRALVTIAGNPVLSTPGGRQLDQALSGLDTMVSVDYYVNETTRHAHLIFPPTSALEHDHYDLVFNALAVRNVARYSKPVFEPDLDARHDWEILLELTRRLQRGPLGTRIKAAIARWQMMALGPRGLLAAGLKRGPHGKSLRLEDLEKAEHGLDLGPLEPCLPDRLATANKHIQLAPRPITEDLVRLRRSMMAGIIGREDGSLCLISRRQPRTNNSWMHNSRRLVKGKEACTLLIHPEDARRIGLKDGEDARLRSRVGEVVAPVELTEDIMPGVVSLPHGWGHDRDGIRLRVASEHPGVSVNDLTDPERVDPLSGNAALSGVPVEIEPAGP
jgi:anaerobic selenocysteine-containing dehydrogenase